MLCTCADVFWSRSGPTRSCDHGEVDARPKSKMAAGKVTSFQVFVTNIHNYCWNYITNNVGICQIEDYTHNREAKRL